MGWQAGEFTDFELWEDEIHHTTNEDALQGYTSWQTRQIEIRMDAEFGLPGVEQS